ncbi:hypothetical protein CAPTEDRAFT_216401 [Capitella teleta]|uniref:Transposable element P transposase-like RNase H domain-containing protein n=1 Tax=Capitella teleta TaxID=283909 RepID=R7UL26_CAPTE|nr:hypothetical protein CAPTEDRAFT_216401 [Capitella teleta]|eukprot:ELU04488.1 hypothetical protein CAPTEDRAFT_216401 [Capitella teleta]
MEQIDYFWLTVYLHSPAAYAIIRKSGIMKLPGETTLRAYTNAIHPTVGFNIHVIMEIKKEADKLPPNQNFVTLLHDEMSIKTGLVYDQRSGELVGFLNQPVDELPTIEEDLATHVLVFYVVGINSKLAMSLGFFPTKGVTASMLYSLLWKAVGWLEGICGLKVMISTSDKAPSNQKLVTFHGTHLIEMGFNIHVIMEIKKEADKLPPNQNFVTLLHDEMSIKTGLVYDQRSGELVGFLNQPVDELPTIEEDLATHVLVFYVVGINSNDFNIG